MVDNDPDLECYYESSTSSVTPVSYNTVCAVNTCTIVQYMNVMTLNVFLMVLPNNFILTWDFHTCMTAEVV